MQQQSCSNPGFAVNAFDKLVRQRQASHVQISAQPKPLLLPPQHRVPPATKEMSTLQTLAISHRTNSHSHPNSTFIGKPPLFEPSQEKSAPFSSPPLANRTDNKLAARPAKTEAPPTGSHSSRVAVQARQPQNPTIENRQAPPQAITQQPSPSYQLAQAVQPHIPPQLQPQLQQQSKQQSKQQPPDHHQAFTWQSTLGAQQHTASQSERIKQSDLAQAQLNKHLELKRQEEMIAQEELRKREELKQEALRRQAELKQKTALKPDAEPKRQTELQQQAQARQSQFKIQSITPASQATATAQPSSLSISGSAQASAIAGQTVVGSQGAKESYPAQMTNSGALSFYHFTQLQDVCKYLAADTDIDQCFAADGSKTVIYTACDFSACKLQSNIDGSSGMTLIDKHGRPQVLEEVSKFGERTISKLTYHDENGRISPWIKSKEIVDPRGSVTVVNYDKFGKVIAIA